MKHRKWIFVLILLLAGCATENPYSKFYHDKVSMAPDSFKSALIKSERDPKIYRSDDQNRDAELLLRQNYALLGHSDFTNTGKGTEKQLLDHAREVGAEIVLVSSKFAGSSQSVLPWTVYKPGQASTTYSTGTINTNIYGPGGTASGTGTYQGSSTTISPR